MCPRASQDPQCGSSPLAPQGPPRKYAGLQLVAWLSRVLRAGLLAGRPSAPGKAPAPGAVVPHSGFGSANSAPARLARVRLDIHLIEPETGDRAPSFAGRRPDPRPSARN